MAFQVEIMERLNYRNRIAGFDFLTDLPKYK